MNVWDERVEAYRRSATHASSEDLDTVVEWCEPREGVKILDVGAGTGRVALKLAAAIGKPVEQIFWIED